MPEIIQPNNIKATATLLQRVGTLFRHQKEVEMLRGEQFNVFSILGMERCENATHSAFLVELLNPTGTHGKAGCFLKLFLDRLPVPVNLDIASTKVFTEYGIGPRDDEKLTGGRLDILLTDTRGGCLTIENKIYAGDQKGQVQRYCKYRPESNIVFYLTLQGEDPSAESRGALQSGKDFYLLSYRDHMIHWLEACYRESADAPILRETIRQYIVLLKKLTITMRDAAQNQEMLSLLFDNYEEAAFIADNFSLYRQQLQDKIRHQVVEALNNTLQKQHGLIATVGDPIQNKYAQVWIWFESYDQATICFGIESFSGTGNQGGDLFVGLFNDKGKSNAFTEKFKFEAAYWLSQQMLKWQGKHIHLRDGELLQHLQRSPQARTEIAQQIAAQAIAFITPWIQQVREYTEEEAAKKPAGTH